MTTYLTPTFSLDENPIPIRPLAFYERRTLHDIHNLVADELCKREAAGELNRATLAKRIRKQPAQISRWINNPGANFTLKTVSQLLLGMGLKLTFSVQRVAEEQVTSEHAIAAQAQSDDAPECEIAAEEQPAAAPRMCGDSQSEVSSGQRDDHSSIASLLASLRTKPDAPGLPSRTSQNDPLARALSRAAA